MKGQGDPHSVSVRLASHAIEIDGREETIALEGADITLAGQEKHRVRIQPPDGSCALIFNDVQVLRQLRQVSGSKTFADKLDKLIAEAADSMDNNSALPPEFIAQDIKDALGHLDELLGRKFSEELLDKIFSKFCIGK